MPLTALTLAACVHYHPAALDQAAISARFDDRTLADPDLARFLAAAGERGLDRGWSPADLGLAAVFYRPQLDVARAEWGEALAGEMTSGARPPFAANAVLERSFAGGAAEPPWGFELGAGPTLELGGKRGARIARARARSFAARARLDETAWSLAAEARMAALGVRHAAESRADSRAELTAVNDLLARLEARYAEGAASRVDVAQTREEAQRLALGATESESDAAEAEARLARAVGVPRAGLSTVTIRPDSIGACEVFGRLAGDSLRVLALRSNRELLRALAEYQVAETDLRLAAAEQSPDLSLGPGLFFDHGISKWVLGAGLSGIRLFGSRGPIAEGEARRTAAGARVAGVQESVIQEIETGITACRGAEARLGAADSLLQAARERRDVTRRAYDRGEVGQTDLALLELGLIRAERARHGALQHRDSVAAGLDAVTGHWLAESRLTWPDVSRSPRDSVNSEVGR